MQHKTIANMTTVFDCNITATLTCLGKLDKQEFQKSYCINKAIEKSGFQYNNMKLGVFAFFSENGLCQQMMRSILKGSYSLISMRKSSHSIAIDKFCIRQFKNKDYPGSQIDYDIQLFEDMVNEAFNTGNYPLIDGYAPFCKHIFIPNFANVKCGYARIDDSIRSKIQSGYESRRPDELPVLTQWISSTDIEAPLATHLDIILYSREQINLETIAMNEVPVETDSPWGIVSIKGQLCDFELPMQPITIFRNSLGKEEGGSGVPLDRDAYMKSVAFWKEHVSIK
jgi:hypothetical protein